MIPFLIAYTMLFIVPVVLIALLPDGDALRPSTVTYKFGYNGSVIR